MIDFSPYIELAPALFVHWSSAMWLYLWKVVEMLVVTIQRIPVLVHPAGILLAAVLVVDVLEWGELLRLFAQLDPTLPL